MNIERIANILMGMGIHIQDNLSLKVSEFDQETPQSHTADQATAPWGKATEHLQEQYI